MAKNYKMGETIHSILPFIKDETNKEDQSKAFKKLKITQSIRIGDDCTLSFNNLEKKGLNVMLIDV